MDMDASSAAPPPLPQPPVFSSSFNVVGEEQEEKLDLRGLIGLAHQLLQQGNPTHALQMVLMAIRSTGGEAAVLHTLDKAKDTYRRKVQSNAAANELASLFAECAISEAQPQLSQALPFASQSLSVNPDLRDTSILAMTGRKQIIVDAFADGSSFVCLQCGGLVSNLRKDEHYAYWCSPI